MADKLTEQIEASLIVGAKIRLGKKYCEGSKRFKAGDVITLIEGNFEYDNGLFTTVQSAPSIWCEEQKDFDSIYHLFGNELEDFADCEIIS